MKWRCLAVTRLGGRRLTFLFRRLLGSVNPSSKQWRISLELISLMIESASEWKWGGVLILVTQVEERGDPEEWKQQVWQIPRLHARQQARQDSPLANLCELGDLCMHHDLNSTCFLPRVGSRWSEIIEFLVVVVVWMTWLWGKQWKWWMWWDWVNVVEKE